MIRVVLGCPAIAWSVGGTALCDGIADADTGPAGYIAFVRGSE